MRASEIGEMKCPVARTLSIVGDPWTLLILRELFLGSRRFEQFQGYTGMSPALLSSRLDRLREEGIIEAEPYSSRPPRHHYRLTDKGLDLYPVILGLSQWGSRWMPDDEGAFLTLVHRACGAESSPALTCSECGEPIDPRQMQVRLEPLMEGDRDRAWSEFKGHTRDE